MTLSQLITSAVLALSLGEGCVGLTQAAIRNRARKNRKEIMNVAITILTCFVFNVRI